VLRLPDLHPLLDAEYNSYDVGVMGELDVRILAELFGGRAVSSAITPAWNGGIYYAVQRKSAVTAAEKESTASLALLYESRWKSRAAAEAFLRIYAAQLPTKYSGVARRDKEEVGTSEQLYSTNEGDVLLSISGTSVFVGEGFPVALARTLRDRITEAQSSGPMQLVVTPQRDPALSLARMFSSFGLMKAAMPERYTLMQQ